MESWWSYDTEHHSYDIWQLYRSSDGIRLYFGSLCPFCSDGDTVARDTYGYAERPYDLLCRGQRDVDL
jgi:hypothetical protein